MRSCRDDTHFLSCQSAIPAASLELVYVWGQATLEAKIIIVFLIFSVILAWSVMIGKALQMGRGPEAQHLFLQRIRTQKHVMDIFNRKSKPKAARSSWCIKPAAWRSTPT